MKRTSIQEQRTDPKDAMRCAPEEYWAPNMLPVTCVGKPVIIAPLTDQELTSYSTPIGNYMEKWNSLNRDSRWALGNLAETAMADGYARGVPTPADSEEVELDACALAQINEVLKDPRQMDTAQVATMAAGTLITPLAILIGLIALMWIASMFRRESATRSQLV
jgi:hypothetical protein